MTHQPEQENQPISTSAELREYLQNNPEARQQIFDELSELSDEELQAVAGGLGGLKIGGLITGGVAATAAISALISLHSGGSGSSGGGSGSGSNGSAHGAVYGGVGGSHGGDSAAG